jgi:hypothetical protein
LLAPMERFWILRTKTRRWKDTVGTNQVRDLSKIATKQAIRALNRLTISRLPYSHLRFVWGMERVEGQQSGLRSLISVGFSSHIWH